MSKLPPPPDPSMEWPSLCKYHSGELEAYGQLCRDQAIDEVARFINGGSFLHDQSPEKLFANQLVPKILELK